MQNEDNYFSLTEEEGAVLLAAARNSIAKKLDLPTMGDIEKLPDILKTPCGAFVTIHIDGALRGCVGSVESQKSLYDTVCEMAEASAFQDHRFTPLKIEEFEKIDLEVSVLTPPKPVDSWRDIDVTRHGIMMEKKGRRALFLPQVAKERGWDISTTLNHLSQKAGLSIDAWQEGATFEVFEALVFGE